MAEKIEVCHCEKCGNEAEMTVSCQMVEFGRSGEIKENTVKLARAKCAETKQTLS